MFGNRKHNIDDNKLPFFVHAIQSADAFALAGQVWQANSRVLRSDPSTKKQFVRFSFAQPACVAWLQRDQDRSDSFELIAIWEGEKEQLIEIFTISAIAGMKIGDDSRATQLLKGILTAPGVVPLGS